MGRLIKNQRGQEGVESGGVSMRAKTISFDLSDLRSIMESWSVFGLTLGVIGGRWLVSFLPATILRRTKGVRLKGI